MGEYDRAIASAKRVIAKKGEACKWHVTAPAVVADSDTPWIETVDGAAPVVHADTFIALFPLSRQFSELIRYLRGTEIVTGSLYGLMSAQSFTPAIADIVERKDGTKLGIVSIDPLAPNGDVILYTIEFKK